MFQLESFKGKKMILNNYNNTQRRDYLSVGDKIYYNTPRKSLPWNFPAYYVVVGGSSFRNTLLDFHKKYNIYLPDNPNLHRGFISRYFNAEIHLYAGKTSDIIDRRDNHLKFSQHLLQCMVLGKHDDYFNYSYRTEEFESLYLHMAEELRKHMWIEIIEIPEIDKHIYEKGNGKYSFTWKGNEREREIIKELNPLYNVNDGGTFKTRGSFDWLHEQRELNTQI